MKSGHDVARAVRLADDLPQPGDEDACTDRGVKKKPVYWPFGLLVDCYQVFVICTVRWRSKLFSASYPI